MVGTHPLADYRKDHGLSRKALADALEVTEVTVGRWENGKRGVRKTLLPKIEDKFGIPPARILQFERSGD
jgi:transcriptional regulator with XRE-family HTH domain